MESGNTVVHSCLVHPPVLTFRWGQHCCVLHHRDFVAASQCLFLPYDTGADYASDDLKREYAALSREDWDCKWRALPMLFTSRYFSFELYTKFLIVVDVCWLFFMLTLLETTAVIYTGRMFNCLAEPLTFVAAVSRTRVAFLFKRDFCIAGTKTMTL